MRLIESAMRVFARQGIDGTVIDDVIAEAGVARGTFYNHFATHEDLVGALHKALDNELLALIDQEVLAHPHPADRMARGIRMALHITQQHRLLARFFARVNGLHAMTDSLALHYMPRDLEAGVAAGVFQIPSIPVGLALALGTTHAAVCAQALLAEGSPAFPEEVAAQVLRGLGVPPAQARRLAQAPLSAVVFPEDSLLGRTLAAIQSA